MKLKTVFIFGPLALWMLLFSIPEALRAEVNENAQWSLQLKDVPISEALSQITRATGLKILLPNGLGNQVVTRTYQKQTIEYILKDLFRNMNYALVWSYGRKGIESVTIMAFGKVEKPAAEQSAAPRRSNIPATPPAGRPSPRRSSSTIQKRSSGSNVQNHQTEASDAGVSECADIECRRAG